MQQLSRFILKLFGWTYIKNGKNINKSVICVAPHTSNWDFILGKLYYSAIGGIQSSFLMKKEWFFFPLGYFFKWMGGIPVNRSKKTSVTDQVAEEFQKRPEFHIAITPEGTRGYVTEWKKGFYYIALKAQVPIELAYIDYEKKMVGIGRIFTPTGDETADINEIKSFYSDKKGRHPEKFHVHRHKHHEKTH